MALGSGNLCSRGRRGIHRQSLVPSPSGLTFRLRFKVFAVQTIDTDSRVGRDPGQLTTRELVSVSQVRRSLSAWLVTAEASVGHRGGGRAHVVGARAGLHEDGDRKSTRL